MDALIEHLSILLLAAGPGAMIGLMAMGLITIFRSSGVLYLAQPAVATVGAYLYLEFSQPGRLSPVAAVAVSSVLTGLLSVLIYQSVMKPLQKTSALTKLVASIGVTQIIVSLLLWRYRDVNYIAEAVFPVGPADLPLGLIAGKDRLLLLLVAMLVTVMLWAVYRFTSFGLRTSAIAESPFFARLYGLRTARLANANWLIAGVLAGFAGSMLASVNGIGITVLTNLLVPVLAAALIGSVTSFPLAMAGAIGIAYVQAEVSTVTSSPGAVVAVPFLVLLAVMMLRGQSSIHRNFTEARLPALGSGRVRWITAGIAVVVLVVSVTTWLPATWLFPLLTSVAMAIILMSIVVLTGFAGQLSLSNMVIAGFGAFCAAHVAATWNWPFPLIVVVAMFAGAVLSTLQTIPALRLKSVSLAVITLGFASVVYATFLVDSEGLPVPSPTLFGLDISTVSSPRTYVALLCIILVAVMIAVANLRQSRSGLRMIAVRGNERVASSLGINVVWTKAVAFAVSGAIAGLGGVLLSYQTTTIAFDTFSPAGSMQLVSWATVGGVAMVAGPVVGSFLAPGGLGTLIGDAIYNDTAVLGAVGGVLLIVTLINHPDGAANLVSQIREHRHARRAAPSTSPMSETDPLAGGETAPPDVPEWQHSSRKESEGRALRVSSVSVNFGGVRALSDVSFTVEPGTVHGLIGSNGSGKTTMLDVVSGFTRPSSGEIWLGDENISDLQDWRRSRAGVGRSFQNGQLLSDFNVGENLLLTGIASGGWVVQDLVAPQKPRLSETALEVARRLELDTLMDAHIDNLTHGKRQLVSIARALASAPAFVLLDEPAAGLDDRERQEFSDLLRNLVAELHIGILLVEHDVAMVLDVCDVVTVLHNGQKIAEGPPAFIRESAEVRAAYLGDSDSVPAAALNEVT